jgi:hypothetical protein
MLPLALCNKLVSFEELNFPRTVESFPKLSVATAKSYLVFIWKGRQLLNLLSLSQKQIFSDGKRRK